MVAFSTKVSPVSSGAAIDRSPGKGCTSKPARNPPNWNSDSFPGFVVAHQMRRSVDTSDSHGLLLESHEFTDAGLAQRDQIGEPVVAERVSLACCLYLDEAAPACHDEVHVDIGRRVLFVAEIK